MKKKKTMSTNGWILIICGLTALVVLTIGFSFGWDFFLPKEEFKITEEECRNESIQMNQVYCPEINFLTTDSEIDFLNKMFEVCNITEMVSKNKICEQVEVDEIKVIESCDIGKEQSLCLTSLIGEATISKQDLTKEWLDINCEGCFNELALDWYEKPDFGNWKNLECSKYKCGDYQVERIK